MNADLKEAGDQARWIGRGRAFHAEEIAGAKL